MKTLNIAERKELFSRNLSQEDVSEADIRTLARKSAKLTTSDILNCLYSAANLKRAKALSNHTMSRSSCGGKLNASDILSEMKNKASQSNIVEKTMILRYHARRKEPRNISLN